MKTKPDEIQVLMSNTLVQSRFEYTEVQLDILFYLLSQLRKNEKEEPVLVYELSVGELENMRGASIKSYRLQEMLDNMGGKPLKIRTADMDDPEDWHSIYLFEQHKYRKGSRLLRLQLTRSIIPFLFDLKREFTSVELYSVLRMTSKYGKRIYQICCQWKNSFGRKKFYIEDLKRMLGCEDEYQQIGQFRQYVLEVAQKQINEHSDLRLEFELEKDNSRSYNVVYFDIQKQQTRQIPIDYHHNEKQAKAKQHLQKLGITDEKLISQILTQHLEAFHKWLFDYQTGKFVVKSSPAGHLLKTLGIR